MSRPIVGYHELYAQLRTRIVQRTLAPGARLPSTRELADEMGIARQTAVRAYSMLLDEGYLESRGRAGTYVAKLVPDRLLAVRGRKARALPESIAVPLGSPRPDPGLFAPQCPALDRFPYGLWARLVGRAARGMHGSQLGYHEPTGLPELRLAIEQHWCTTRGASIRTDSTVVTAGAQNAFELIARALAKPGDHVAVESPGYKYAHRAFSAAGLTLVEVPVDGQGLVVEALERLAVKPRLIYVTPAHQQPTGVVLSASRRLALLDYARQSNSWIVEDDYDSEFRYAASPLSVLQSLDAHGRVILVSSFSKTMFPAVRLGFVSVPHPPALQAVARELDSSLRFVSPLEQKAMALFISEGHYARHLRAMRRCYAERRDHLRRLLEGPAGRRIREVLDLQWPHTGFAAIGWFRQPRAELKALVLAGQSRGLELVATSATAQQRQGLLLGFGAIPDDRMADAVARLSAVL